MPKKITLPEGWSNIDQYKLGKLHYFEVNDELSYCGMRSIGQRVAIYNPPQVSRCQRCEKSVGKWKPNG